MHRSEFPPSGDGAAPPAAPLSDEAIYDIAAEIRAAFRRRGPITSADHILAAGRELPGGDEERVITALAVLELLEGLPRA